MVILPHEELQSFARAILEAAGVPAMHAELVADSLVAANLRGVDSHGVQLLIPYVEFIRGKNVDLEATGRVASESGACIVYDGMNAIGQVIAASCTDHAVRLARAHGIGMVTVREANHFGAAAYWAQRISRAGMIGVAFCNATPLVAPWQGRERRFGTNPISMALPGTDRWLLDMATTTVALNRIYKALLAGQPTIPEGWALDKDGNPTTNTEAGMNGMPMPLGGYKGYGLAMMVEILCSVLSGGAMSTEVGGLRVQGRPMRVSHCFLAIDAGRFLPVEEFASRMGRLCEMMKSSAPATGYDEVLVAGEPEWRAEAERRASGIPLDDGVWRELTALADTLGMDGRRNRLPHTS